MRLNWQKQVVHLTMPKWKKEASALIVSRNINVNTNFCEMSSKFLMRNECGTDNARRFFRILSRGENIPVLRKELNDAPAASVPAFANGFDGFWAKIAFPKIPVFFHGGKDTGKCVYKTDKF